MEYMYSNQLHINLTKSVYMHFRPHLNQSERQTCARTRIDESLKLANYKLKRVRERSHMTSAAEGGGGFEMLTVADKGGRGSNSKPC